MSEKEAKTLEGVSPKYRVTYFNFRWIAEPIRLILSYVKEEFEDVRFAEDSSWTSVKHNYPYGFLPTLDDLEVGVRLTQSFAITRYLGKKYNLVGANDIETYKCDEYADCIKDLLKEVETMYLADEAKDEVRKAEIKKNFLSVSIPKYLTSIDADITANGDNYMVGKGITWVDILMAHFMHLFEVNVEKSVLDNYPNIKAHQQRIFDIPAIKEWIDKRPVTEY